MNNQQTAENVNSVTEFVAPLPSPSVFLIWLPTLLWTTMLCVFSTESFGYSHTFSVMTAIHAHIPHALGFLNPRLLNLIARKGAHFSIYVGYFFVLVTGPLRGRPWTAFLICMLAGSCDEIHQIFVPGRTASPYDVGIDSSGAMFARLAYLGFIEAV